MQPETATTQSALAYYAAHGAALFPIPARKKDPWGIIHSFAHDFSTDPAQWQAWRRDHADCNFGLVAGPSRLIIVDTDIKELGRERAWQLYAEWFTSRGLPVYPPHVQSASGGWHTLFSVPDGTLDLRQPALVQATEGSKKAIVEVRAGNGYVVAAGSYYDGTPKGEPSGPYLFLTGDAPHPAPAALIEHCTRVQGGTAIGIGTRDPADVADMLLWMTARNMFEPDESWYQIGMALRLEFGDAVGLPLWRITHRDPSHPKAPTQSEEQSRWNSFATEPAPGVKTLNSFMKDAHAAGWSGSIRTLASPIFDAVAKMAASAGATLPSILTAGRSYKTAEIGLPTLDNFMSATADEPTRPANPNFPSLPPDCASHPLYESLQSVISRIIAMAESPKSFTTKRVRDALAVLYVVHKQVCEQVMSYIQAMGANLDDNQVRRRGDGLSEEIERALRPQHDWHRDTKGLIEHNNSDNVSVFLETLGAEVRFNGWLERIEIKGYDWSDWTHLDDSVFAQLMVRADRTGTRFTPAENFMWRTLVAIGRRNTFDPVLSLLAQLQKDWDGQPRLATWLTGACGTPNDAYHSAVGANIIGGMVRRVRQPGCKHDEMAVFIGYQGAGKSKLGKALALQDEWFTDSVLLGDESKELILSLAGKMVAEISEMGSRNSDVNRVKAMLSKTSDRGRPAYGRSVIERQRRNIFIGSTNITQPLIDTTGNRRFLPVHVDREIDVDWVRANIGQLIGEAARLQAGGATFAIPREVWGEAAKRQDAARSETDTEIRLEHWFACTTFTENAYVLSADLSELASMVGWRGGLAERGAAMRQLGFRSEAPYVGGKKTRVWYRGEPTLPKNIEAHSVRYEVGRNQDGRPKVTPRGPICP